MIDAIFHQTAADAGWNDAAQVGVLLRYAAHAGSTATLRIFLDRERLAADDTDPFTDAVIAALGDPGLALDHSFRRYCAGCRDLLTVRQAAERWCCWRAG
ncbi:hypothetical protein [uncultured Sphingomonas sp.]|uniref:hypothetical protein n=1 Tax=uncultured Sphingomonas sp. TaxID=158754 RepID=UPI0030D88E17